MHDKTSTENIAAEHEFRNATHRWLFREDRRVMSQNKTGNQFSPRSDRFREHLTLLFLLMIRSSLEIICLSECEEKSLSRHSAVRSFQGDCCRHHSSRLNMKDHPCISPLLFFSSESDWRVKDHPSACHHSSHHPPDCQNSSLYQHPPNLPSDGQEEFVSSVLLIILFGVQRIMLLILTVLLTESSSTQMTKSKQTSHGWERTRFVSARMNIPPSIKITRFCCVITLWYDCSAGDIAGMF